MSSVRFAALLRRRLLQGAALLLAGAALPLAAAPVAVVAVESGAKADVVVLRGGPVYDLLAKGCPLDLHPKVFDIGQWAQSHLAKGPVLLRLAPPPMPPNKSSKISANPLEKSNPAAPAPPPAP